MVEVGGQAFDSVAEVREYVANMLHNAPIDEPLSGTDGKVIHEIFLHHPEAKEKQAGKEIEFFKVGTHPQAGARAFCVVRSDGSEETFSMKKCLSPWARKASGDVKTPKSTAKQNKPSQQKPSQANIQDRLKRVITLYNELGREIQQIQKIIVEDK